MQTLSTRSMTAAVRTLAGVVLLAALTTGCASQAGTAIDTGQQILKARVVNVEFVDMLCTTTGVSRTRACVRITADEAQQLRDLGVAADS